MTSPNDQPSDSESPQADSTTDSAPDQDDDQSNTKEIPDEVIRQGSYIDHDKEYGHIGTTHVYPSNLSEIRVPEHEFDHEMNVPDGVTIPGMNRLSASPEWVHEETDTDEQGDEDPVDDEIDHLDDELEELTDMLGPSKYIQITPVRAETSAESVVREWYGMHNLANGRDWPLDLDDKLPWVDSLSRFEFIIHKPEGEPRFNFYIGIDNEEDLDRADSSIRSQYPEDFEFETNEFRIAKQFDDVPHITRWEGIESKRRDWMGLLGEYDNYEDERAPISNLLETMTKTDGETVFQVVFEPRADWTGKAERRKRNLKLGVNSMAGMFFQQFLDRLVGVSQMERRQRHQGDTPEEVGGTIHDTEAAGARRKTTRMGQIDLKQPASTFNVSARLASDDPQVANNATSALNHLSGQFYQLEGNYLGQHKEEYYRMLKCDITTPTVRQTIGKRKPLLVLSPEELANFTTVPGIDDLPKASRGGTGGSPRAQSPLTSPDEETFQNFGHNVGETGDGGMCIGVAATAHDNEDELDQLPDKKTTDFTKWASDDKTDEWWRHVERDEALHLQADHLTQHYIRAGTTGSGKTVATINDILTAYHYLDGPVILIDPKGGDMCENYLRSHKRVFGDISDVEYIKVPEQNKEIPGMPFFDLRPLLGAGKPRNTAIQDKLDHYREVLRHILGEQTFDQAFVANEILINLIKAVFEDGNWDHFTIQDLLEVARDYRRKEGYWDYLPDEDEQEEASFDRETLERRRKSDEDYLGITTIDRLPDDLAPENNSGERPDETDIEGRGITHLTIDDESTRGILEEHAMKDAQDFRRHTDAVLNRITKLKERDFIWNILNQEISDDHWDSEDTWYRDSAQLLDLRDVLQSNKVFMIDTGDLRSESSEIFTVLFLSYLWTSVTSLDLPESDNYVTNVIIEESAPISRTRIVYEDLLPQGREFTLSLGLIMQYPEQVLGKRPTANEHVYREVLNNINTKIIGNIAMDDDLADALFHEGLDTDQIKDRIQGLPRGEWVVQLPPTGFQEKKPELLTLKPLPIPPAHTDSDGRFLEVFDDYSPEAVSLRADTREDVCVNPLRDDTERDDEESGESPPDPGGSSPDTDAEDDESPAESGDTDDDTEDGEDTETFGDEDADSTTGSSTTQPYGSPTTSSPADSEDRDTIRLSDINTITENTYRELDLYLNVDELPDNLSIKEATFIKLVMKALNQEIEDYDITQSMGVIPGAENYSQQLEDKGYIDILRPGNLDQDENEYYLPTTIGRGAVDEQLTHGEHVGDLGESPLHRVITYLTGVYYQQEGYNARAYVNADKLEDYESDSDEAKPDVFDVIAEAGLGTDDEIVEVELEETKGDTRYLRPREMVRDLAKLSQQPGLSTWVFERREARDKFLELLADESIIEEIEQYLEDGPAKAALKQVYEQCEDGGLIESIPRKSRKGNQTISEQLDIPGCDKVLTFPAIYDDIPTI